MASGTASPPPQHGPIPPPPPARPPDPYETLIDERVRYTRRQVKRVDIAAGLLTLAVGVLGYLLVAALVDHWVVPGGLGPTGRLVLFLILAAGSVAYFGWRVLPLLIRRINPLFAAYTIEQSRPSLKNSLINLLFLRGDRAQIQRDILAQRIYQGLERTAAADLSHVAADTAVDHSQVIRKGYLLAGVVAIAALYLALSPKNPLVSFGRVMFPWSGIRPPTRVTIDRVEPGDSVVYQGDYVTLSAEVHGLDDGEAVHLYYTTADGQSVDQALPMTLSEGEYRHRCQLPPGPLGIQQETRYHIRAGDCTTQQFRLEVQPALSIRVDAVDYHYPEYTGLSDRTVQGQGDIRAIEGTQVTVRATASHPIQQARIEMDCKRQLGLHMTSSGTAATGQFTLSMTRADPTRPEHDSYQVRFRDADGNEDRRPTRHRIEVIRDLPPEIHLLEPPPDGAQFPVDGVLSLRVRAEDPDFALRSVALRLEVEGKTLLIPPLLNKSRPNPPHQGPFEGAHRFEPSKLGLKAGDKVKYFAEATDNKEPVANRTETAKRTLLLVPPQGQNSPQERSDRGGQGQPRNQDKQNDRSKQDDSKQPERDGAKSQDGQPDKAQDKQKDSDAKSDQMQPDQPQPKEDSPKSDKQDQQNQQDQQGQKGGQQGQGGQGAQGDSSDSGEGQGQSGKPSGKQDQSASPQSGQKGEGDQSQEGNQSGQSQDGSSSSTGSQGSGQKRDGQAGAQSGQPQQPVDGQSNPGDVFDKALQRRAEEKGEQKGEGGKGKAEGTQQSGDGKQQNADGKQQNADGKQQSSREAAELAPRDSQQSADGNKQNADGKQQSADGKQQSADGKSQSSREAAELAPRGSQDPRKPDTDEKKSPMADSGERPDQRGGDRDSPSGSAADKGQSPEEKKAGALPEEGPRERPNSAGPQDKKSSQPPDSATSPSTDRKSSSTQGDMGGDRSGGGEQGGGQNAKQAGKDTPGTQSDAEKGASRSEQKGDGQTGDRGGDQAKSDQPTGQSAKADGPGSRQQPGDGKAQNADANKQNADGKPEPSREAAEPAPRDSQQKADGQPGDSRSGADSTPPGSQPPQGGQPAGAGPQPGAGHPAGGGMSGPQSGAAAEEAKVPGDPYNREFAEKQTTLALEYLKDQLAKEKPDPKLLDQLGWNRQDLESFVNRWETMRRAAVEPGPSGEAAKRKFDEALKSLGLRPRGTVLRGGSTNRDQMRNLKEGGRFDPPPEWSEMLRAYNRGVAGAKE